MKLRNSVIMMLLLGTGLFTWTRLDTTSAVIHAWASESEAIEIGWNGNKYSEDGVGFLKGFYELGGKLYYFDDKNELLPEGIQEIEGKTYLILADGSVLKGDGFVDFEGSTYYIGETGIYRGKLALGAKQYYFDEEGKLIKSTFFKEGGYTLYSKEDGTLARSWTRIDGKLYYFNPIYRFMLSGGIAEINGGSYLFMEDGEVLGPDGIFENEGKLYHTNARYVLSKGMVNVGEDTYYFTNDFSAVRNARQKIADKLYLFDEDGRMVKNAGVTLWNNGLYEMNPDGSLKTGWQRVDGKLYYFNPVYGWGLRDGQASINGVNYLFREDGSVLEGKGFVKDEDKTYYIGAKGVVVGPQKIDGKDYIFSKDGILAKSGFFKEGNTTYYINEDGSLASSWTRIDGKLYYFNPSYHFMLWGGIAEINGGSYLFKDDGEVLGPEGIFENKGKLYHINARYVLSKGMVTVGEDTYYFKNDFSAVKNTSQRIGDKIYLFDEDGRMLRQAGVTLWNKGLYAFNVDGSLKTGWQRIDGKLYYFNPVYGWGLRSGQASINGVNYLFREDGSVLEGKGFVKDQDKTYYIGDKGVVVGQQTINGKAYIFSKDGILASPGFFTEGDKTYYINENGELVTGFIKIGDHTYYFHYNTYTMLKNGVYKIGAKGYAFSPEGHWIDTPGFYHVGNKTYYIKDNYDHDLISGSYTVDGKEYYFSKDNFAAIKNGGQAVNGRLVYFDENGVRKKEEAGIKVVNNHLYYFNEDGTLKTGWQYYGSKKYYFNPVYGWGLRGGKATIQSSTYLFNDDGSVYKGWKNDKGVLSYYDPINGYQYKSMPVRIDGVIRLFNENGENIRKKGLHRVAGYDYFVGDSGEVYENKEFIYENKKYVAAGTRVRRIVPNNSWEVINGNWYRYDYAGNLVDSAVVGHNFVIVSVDHQRMWVYNHGREVVSTPVVTGLIGRHNTPRGHWAVWDKSSPTPLIPNCRYWLAFQSLNGIHDAPWQPWFGGNRYLYAGSHGCVNTPPHIMPTVYHNVFLHTPVIVY